MDMAALCSFVRDDGHWIAQPHKDNRARLLRCQHIAIPVQYACCLSARMYVFFALKQTALFKLRLMNSHENRMDCTCVLSAVRDDEQCIWVYVAQHNICAKQRQPYAYKQQQHWVVKILARLIAQQRRLRRASCQRDVERRGWMFDVYKYCVCTLQLIVISIEHDLDGWSAICRRNYHVMDLDKHSKTEKELAYDCQHMLGVNERSLQHIWPINRTTPAAPWKRQSSERELIAWNWVIIFFNRVRLLILAFVRHYDARTTRGLHLCCCNGLVHFRTCYSTTTGRWNVGQKPLQRWFFVWKWVCIVHIWTLACLTDYKLYHVYHIWPSAAASRKQCNPFIT